MRPCSCIRKSTILCSSCSQTRTVKRRRSQGAASSRRSAAPLPLASASLEASRPAPRFREVSRGSARFPGVPRPKFHEILRDSANRRDSARFREMSRDRGRKCLCDRNQLLAEPRVGKAGPRLASLHLHVPRQQRDGGREERRRHRSPSSLHVPRRRLRHQPFVEPCVACSQLRRCVNRRRLTPHQSRPPLAVSVPRRRDRTLGSF